MLSSVDQGLGREIEELINESYNTLEERKSLSKLDLFPSAADNLELNNLLNKILKKLNYLEDDLLSQINTFNNLKAKISKKREMFVDISDLMSFFNNLNKNYEKLLDSIDLVLEKESVKSSVPRQTLRIDDFKFIKKSLPEMIPLSKSVRFKDDLVQTKQFLKDDILENPEAINLTLRGTVYQDSIVDNSAVASSMIGNVHFTDNVTELEHNKQKLFGGLRSKYKDDASDNDSSNDYLADNSSHSAKETSNVTMLQEQQQLLVDQDSQLNILSDSVRRQRDMGISINDELDTQVIIMDDLESQMNSAEIRLRKAKNNLRIVNQKMKEHGYCFTITVLAFTLFLLVIIL